MLGNTRKGIAAPQLVAIFLVTIITLGLGYFATQIVGLLELVLNNWFWLVVGAVILGVIGLFIIQAYQERLENTFLAVFLLIFVAIGLPAIGLTFGHITTSYEATAVVEVEEGTLGIGYGDDPEFVQGQIVEVEETGGQIFSLADTNPEQACLVGCDEWNLDITYTCDGETIGTRTVSGTGTGTVEDTVGGLPSGTQCEATFVPQRGLEGAPQTASFSTR